MKTTTIKGDKLLQEERLYISSLPANARRLNQAARFHSGIENQLHWRLDVTFNEDAACIRNDNAGENVDILQKWAFLFYKKQNKSRISQLRVGSGKMLCRLNILGASHATCYSMVALLVLGLAIAATSNNLRYFLLQFVEGIYQIPIVLAL